MRLKYASLFALASITLLSTKPARAQYVPSIAIGPVIGTTGVGIEASTPIVPGWVNLNAGFTTFDISDNIDSSSTIARGTISYGGNSITGVISGSPYHGRVHLGAIPVFLTVYPFGGWFNVQGGIYFNNNRISANRTYSINGVNFGNLSGSTHFNIAAPYLGIGFGQPFSGGRLTFTGSLGVMFEGSPNIRLQPSAQQVEMIPQINQMIQHDQRTLNNDATWAQFYPVLNLGLEYRF